MSYADPSKLKRKILVLFLSGIAFLSIQFYYYHFLLVLGGAGCLLFAFFSIKSAEGNQYKKEDIKQLMYYPLATGVLAGAIAFWYRQDILFSIFSVIAAVGLYTLVQGRVLLNFNGYKVYTGFYAYVVGSLLSIAGLALVMVTLTATPTHYWPKPTKNWNGEYQINLEPVQDTCVNFAKITINPISNDRYYQSGQYQVNIYSFPGGCDSDTSVLLPQFDDITAWGIEKGDTLLLVAMTDDDKQKSYDTLFVWTRDTQSIHVTPLQFDYKTISSTVVKMN